MSTERWYPNRKGIEAESTRKLLMRLRLTYKCRPDGSHGAQKYYVGYSAAEIKAELAKRPHIPNKAEAKALRQKEAKRKKNK